MLLKYICSKSDSSKSVKQIIDNKFSLSARTLSKLKSSGGILVNGKSVTVRHILKENDKLTLSLSDTQNEKIKESNIPLDILYEDEYLLCVNKPSNMPVHPSSKHHDDTLANAVMYRYRDNPFTFRAITRLDGDTTGVVLIAKDALSAQRLTDRLMKGNIKKEYCAVVEGIPKEKNFTIDAPISRCPDSIIKRMVDKGGKEAVTEVIFDSSSTSFKYSLLKVYPLTGRTHQIRLHLSHKGFPIYGDFLYGKEVSCVRTLLHCSSLSFIHPITNIPLKITSPLPKDIISIMQN